MNPVSLRTQAYLHGSCDSVRDGMLTTIPSFVDLLHFRAGIPSGCPSMVMVWEAPLGTGEPSCRELSEGQVRTIA